MLTTLNNERHGSWGRVFPGYFKSYTNQALAAPLSPSEDASARINATKTIQWIIALGMAPKGAGIEANRYISLPMLKSIIDAAKIPEEVQRLADPRVVTGCVELMASVEPVFEHEYGYVCFCILNLAIGACMLRQFGQFDRTMERMSSAPVSLVLFWSDVAALVHWDIKRGGRLALGLCGEFTAGTLDRLVELLHGDQKQYFIVLKVLQSTGLAGLMLVLRANLQVGGVNISSDTSSGDLVESLVQPYSRLLWRYMLALPAFIEHETKAIFQVHIYITCWARFRDSYYIDIEDSRNLLQALNEHLLSSSTMTHLAGGLILLRFVEPLVVPGCEDLIPTLVERSLRLMWSSILDEGPGSSAARVYVAGVLTCIRYIFQEIKPKSFAHQKWIVELVDGIIDEGLTDLVLRVLVAAPDFVPGQQDVTERLYNVASEVYVELVYLVPKSYLISRLNDSGVLDDWRKYINHFFGVGNPPQASSSSSLRSSLKACGEVLTHTVMAVIDKSDINALYSIAGSCDNPRCAIPCEATFICSECVDLMYCSVRCLAVDWSSPSPGLHKRVCKQQAMANPKSRSSYHRTVRAPERKGMSTAQKNDMDAPDMVLSYYCDVAEWLHF